MSDTETKDKSIIVTEENKQQITPIRCFTGASISGALAIAAYLLTKSVILTYTTMPIKFNNQMAASIASSVRTLIMGVTTMATFLFLMVTVGLIGLGIKLIIDNSKIINN
ncbi:DUF3082 domain-containing protein [Geminocystis sp. NIES-3709]|uniref:DUF3082 domain-containing protein n=1 Tax=Geminocystis sp. NIES-3709 TaxID=1617448 RepID=UPI0005FC5F29|nr:DUF3082 domain-containing protein [Geminocystis sp. NIES-3709]BAQ64059.1 hypothetical protein GM3709_824 [Geminocystis sp. NIES-3709]